MTATVVFKCAMYREGAFAVVACPDLRLSARKSREAQARVHRPVGAKYFPVPPLATTQTLTFHALAGRR
jgi:hypothetical protein